MRLRTKIVIQIAVTFLITFLMSILLLKVGGYVEYSTLPTSPDSEFDVDYVNFSFAALPALVLIVLWNVKKVSKFIRRLIVALVALVIICILMFPLAGILNNIYLFNYGFSPGFHKESSPYTIEVIFIAVSMVISLTYISLINSFAAKTVKPHKAIFLSASITIACLIPLLLLTWAFSYSNVEGKATSVEEYSPTFKKAFEAQEKYVNVMKNACEIKHVEEKSFISQIGGPQLNYELAKNKKQSDMLIKYEWGAYKGCADKTMNIISEFEKLEVNSYYTLKSSTNEDSATNKCLVWSENGGWIKENNVEITENVIVEDFPCNAKEYDELSIVIRGPTTWSGTNTVTFIWSDTITSVETIEGDRDSLELEEIPATVGSWEERHEFLYGGIEK